MLFVLDVFIAYILTGFDLSGVITNQKPTKAFQICFGSIPHPLPHQELLFSQIPHLRPIKRPVWGDPSAFSHSDLYPPFHLPDPNALACFALPMRDAFFTDVGIKYTFK